MHLATNAHSRRIERFRTKFINSLIPVCTISQSSLDWGTKATPCTIYERQIINIKLYMLNSLPAKATRSQTQLLQQATLSYSERYNLFFSNFRGVVWSEWKNVRTNVGIQINSECIDFHTLHCNGLRKGQGKHNESLWKNSSFLNHT